MSQNILIVGAQGKTGARVNQKLIDAGLHTRGVSRSSSPAFDWTDSDGWKEAMQGMDAAYLTYHPDLSVPEAETHIQHFCQLAIEVGITHVVLLSGRGEEGASNAEAALKNSGLKWNIIQASWFAQNFSENFMLDGVLEGQLVFPTGTAVEPFIDIDDIADVAVATFLEPGLHNRLFEVTGPRLMSFKDCAQEISNAAGLNVEVLEVPMEQYLAALREQELPEPLVELLRDLFADLFDGRNAYVAKGVEEALGRSAADFRDYAAKTAATSVWSQGVAR